MFKKNKKVKKRIRLGDYLKKADYANRILPNKYDVMMYADGYLFFKHWGKGKIAWTVHYGTWIASGTLNKELRMGLRLLSIEFDDKKTNYYLKADIIDALKKFHKDGGWKTGTWKNVRNIKPEDLKNLKIEVESRYW